MEFVLLQKSIDNQLQLTKTLFILESVLNWPAFFDTLWTMKKRQFFSHVYILITN